ncbi:MAG: 50S ribosomal protein L24 [bacterium]
MKIKRNDIVVATRGRDAGKTGKVLLVDPVAGRVLVEGINLVTKHVKKSQDDPKGGIIHKEALMAVANLALQCPHCKKGVRVRRVVEADKRIRRCAKCGHGFDA